MNFLKKINLKIVTAMVLFAVLLSGIAVLLILGLYSVPYYDDYGAGIYAKNALSEGRGLIGALKAAAANVRLQWYAWQGTHFSIFLMSLMPAIWGEQFYGIGAAFLIINMTVGIFVLAGTLCNDILKIDKYYIISIQSLTSIIVLLFIYSAQQGFYWFNGGIHYVGMHGYLLFFVACLIHLLYTKNKCGYIIMTVIAIFGGILIGGANFVTALQFAVIFVSLVVIGLLKKNRNTLFFIPTALAFAFSFYKNISAPGNSVRQACYWYVDVTPVQAILRSFPEAAHFGREFTDWKTIALFILFIPIAVKIAQSTEYRFKLWKFLIIAAWSFCFFATGFTPSLYATGEIVLARVINVIKINYHLLVVLNEIYFIGMLTQIVIEKNIKLSDKFPKVLRNSITYTCCILILSVFLSMFAYRTEPDHIGKYSVYGAYYYLKSGEAQEFYEEYLERLATLKTDETDIVFTSYTVKPWFLISKDLSDNPDDEPNRYLASYYGKNSVVVKSEY